VSAHSNPSSFKETKRAFKSLKKKVPHLICTSKSQVCSLKSFFTQRD
jgi:hypothetical protein